MRVFDESTERRRITLAQHRDASDVVVLKFKRKVGNKGDNTKFKYLFAPMGYKLVSSKTSKY